MERPKRFGMAALWILVAALVGRVVAVGTVPAASAEGAIRLLVVALSLGLAVVYALDPGDVVSERPF